MKNTIWICLIGALLVSCGGNNDEKKKPEEKKNPPVHEEEVQHEGITPEQAAKVVAVVGERKITVGDVTEEINRLSPYIRRRWAAPEKRKEFLQKLIRVELLSQEAERLGLDSDPEVQRTVKQVMIRLMVKNDLEKELLPSSIDDKLLREEYKKDYDKYHRSPQIRASHIVVASKEGAEKLLAKLKEHESERKFFREKAKELSIEEKTKKRGGDIGYFSKPEEKRDDEPDVPEKVALVAWKIEKVGTIADEIVQTEAGFHIIKLTNKKPEMNRSFESVKRLIENRVLRKMRREGMKKFVDGLREKAKIEIFEENLAKLETNVPDTNTKPGSEDAEDKESGKDKVDTDEKKQSAEKKTEPTPNAEKAGADKKEGEK